MQHESTSSRRRAPAPGRPPIIATRASLGTPKPGQSGLAAAQLQPGALPAVGPARWDRARRAGPAPPGPKNRGRRGSLEVDDVLVEGLEQLRDGLGAVHHVVPRAQGGVSSWENCVLACMACNKRKADRTPEQAKMRVRKKPVRPAWKPLYADHSMRMESWSKFISEAYWNVTLKE